MGSNDTKATIKAIRDAVKAGKHQEAVEKCGNLLREDPKCYMAYLLLGATYQNVDKREAARHLRKAVEYAPGPPIVPLQGLANCASLDELPKIYEQLLALVPDKYSAYYERLHSLSGDSKNVAVQCQQILQSEVLIHQGERQKDAFKILARIWLENELEVTANEEPVFQQALEYIVDDVDFRCHFQANKHYLNLKYREGALADCIRRTITLISLYPENAYLYEFLCKIYDENYQLIGNNNAACVTELDKTIEPYAEKLLQFNERSGYALMVKAIKHYQQEQYVQVRDLMELVINNLGCYAPAVELLARVYMKMGAWVLALKLWEKIGKTKTLEYAICLSYESGRAALLESVAILEALMPRSQWQPQVTSALARCYHKLQEQEKFQTLNLDPLLKAQYEMSAKQAIQFVLANDYGKTFEGMLLVAKLHLEQQQYEEALAYILHATRLQPYKAECWYIMGEIYHATGDKMRARKCLEKCVNFDPACEAAVNLLSSIYYQEGEVDLNAALLANSLNYIKGSTAQRLHYKLGLHFLNVGKCDDAIQSLRTAIKYNNSCLVYWESLGDAYNERGSYHSAIRVFQKVLELDEKNKYAKLQLAVVKTTIRMYDGAVKNFNELLEMEPDYLPALKGAAEAHIGLAQNYKRDHFYGRCKDHLQLAVNHLERAFMNQDNKNMVWLWRLTATVFLETAKMPFSLANLDVCGKLGGRESEVVFLNREDLLHLAIRFFTCALKIKQNTFLWYDLAHCCFHTAKLIPEETETHIKLAISACKMALKFKSDRWMAWNLLGVIYMHPKIDNLPLAQHCFIQALNCDRKSYTVWTNLGALYFHLEDIKLANQAFQRAQQANPIYQNAWIGQAMIAETIGEYEEAIDLFRHCQQFEYHPESAIGYAHWVATILSDEKLSKQPHYRHAIESMHADIVAMDAINCYVTNEEDNAPASAFSFQGFFYERQGKPKTALQVFKKAAQKTDNPEERNKMLINVGYLCLKLGEPNEAINSFNAVSHASFKAVIGLALAHFRAGQYEESYTVYSTLLKSLIGMEDDKAGRIMVAMASMLYASQGELDTRTVLYQGILLKEAPIEAYYAACALGILHNDMELMNTILPLLKSFESTAECVPDIAYIRSQYFHSRGLTHFGLTYLVAQVHIFPYCPELRIVLVKYILDYMADKRYCLFTFNIAVSAMHLMQKNSKKTIKAKEHSDLLLLASRTIKPVDTNLFQKFMQKAIHIYPNNVEDRRSLVKSIR